MRIVQFAGTIMVISQAVFAAGFELEYKLSYYSNGRLCVGGSPND